MTKTQLEGKSYYAITKGLKESGILIESDDKTLIEYCVNKISLNRTHSIERINQKKFTSCNFEITKGILGIGAFHKRK